MYRFKDGDGEMFGLGGKGPNLNGDPGGELYNRMKSIKKKL